jgi:hypothetical protein
MIYSLYTLVDITETRTYRSRSDLERLQQQNFDTIISVISLSGNVYYDGSPKKIPASIFGMDEDMCWYFEWRMELEGLFEKHGDPLYKLKQSFEFIPYIPNLTETTKFVRSIFILGRNIVFDFRE